MNPYVTGTVIKGLREGKGLTQAQLAARLQVSDKAVSKWETAKGYPDITLIEPLAQALDISVMELLSGDCVTNANRAGNLLRAKWYVCPICGNIIHSTGAAVLWMMSFLAGVSDEGVQLIKLYPEGNPETRLKLRRMKWVYAYCNRHGLYRCTLP